MTKRPSALRASQKFSFPFREHPADQECVVAASVTVWPQHPETGAGERRIHCESCGQPLIMVRWQQAGWRQLRSYGALPISTGAPPGSVLVQCSKCGESTEVRRAVLGEEPVGPPCGPT